MINGRLNPVRHHSTSMKEMKKYIKSIYDNLCKTHLSFNKKSFILLNFVVDTRLHAKWFLWKKV